MGRPPAFDKQIYAKRKTVERGYLRLQREPADGTRFAIKHPIGVPAELEELTGGTVVVAAHQIIAMTLIELEGDETVPSVDALGLLIGTGVQVQLTEPRPLRPVDQRRYQPVSNAAALVAGGNGKTLH